MKLYFEPRHGLRHVVVVGLGGTGSHLARSVARIVYDMRARRMHPPQVTFIDPDTVENKNVGRQMFLPADVGHNKAVLLARRFNCALGLDIAAIPEPYDPDRHPSGRNVLLIGCVDTQVRPAAQSIQPFAFLRPWRPWMLSASHTQSHPYQPHPQCRCHPHHLHGLFQRKGAPVH